MKKKIEKKKQVEKEVKISYAANSGEVMNDTGIVGDGCLVKKSE